MKDLFCAHGEKQDLHKMEVKLRKKKRVNLEEVTNNVFLVPFTNAF